MASTDARPVPIKNTAFRVYFPILDADGDLVTGATALDSEVSLDGAAFSDCTNEATEIGSTGLYYLDLTSGEMNADAVIIQVKTSSAGAKTTPIILYPEETGDINVDVTAWLGTAASTPTVAGVPNVNVKTWNDLTTVALPLVPTTAGRTLDVSAGGEAGVDWANIGSPTTTVALTGTTVGTITTYTGNTPQTGDSYAIVNSGTHGNAALKTILQSSGVVVDTFTVTGKAQVESEVNDALVVVRLDELLAADSDIDGAAPPTVGSVFHELMSKTAGSFTFDQTTDSNEALRDRGDAAWITATGFSTHSAADVWAAATRTLTAGTNIVLAKGVGVTGFNDLSFADIWSGTALTEAYAADGATVTPAQAFYMIWAFLAERTLSGTTLTVKKLDGTTTAMTFTTNSATTPSSYTRAT